MSNYIVVDKRTGNSQASGFTSEQDARDHIARVLRQWQGAEDAHPGPDLAVFAEVK
jgi:hypothetical protein